jgi:hypothetical protein
MPEGKNRDLRKYLSKDPSIGRKFEKRQISARFLVVSSAFFDYSYTNLEINSKAVKGFNPLAA